MGEMERRREAVAAFPVTPFVGTDARAPLLSRRLDYPHLRDRANSRHGGDPTA